MMSRATTTAPCEQERVSKKKRVLEFCPAFSPRQKAASFYGAVVSAVAIVSSRRCPFSTRIDSILPVRDSSRVVARGESPAVVRSQRLHRRGASWDP